MHVVLVNPQIAPNTGNVIRLSANAGATLHLVEPLGFSLEDRLLRRAGLDYHDLADVQIHPSWDAVAALFDGRVFLFTSHGQTRYDQVSFEAGDWLVFGPESTGLSADVLATVDRSHHVVVPMRANNRSINLATQSPSSSSRRGVNRFCGADARFLDC
ncbi:MAG: tRNA (cytidine(34)-2'-O)-methyltransferase [Acidimicrobiales bacterium]